MSNAALDIVGIVIGCALYMAIIIVALTWRELKLKKLTVEQDTKGFVAMRLYKEHWNAERERRLKNNDKTS